MGRAVQALTGTLVLAVAAAMAIVLQEPPTQAESFAEALQSVDLTMDLPPDLHIVRTQVRGERLSSALLQSGPTTLRLKIIEDLDMEEAARLAGDIRLRLNMLFQDRQAPYPGHLSNTLRCAPEFHPVDVADRGDALMLVRLFANDRLAFGGCSSDLLSQAATVGLVYDPEGQRMVRLEVFEPRAEASDRGLAWIRSLKP